MKKIKQINNFVIEQDTARQISYFGNIMDNPNYLKYSVFNLDGKCLEDRLTLEQAEIFVIQIKVLCKRKDNTYENDKIVEIADKMLELEELY